VLIPSVCWPTSLWPLVQAGLKPVFIDVEANTLNVDAEKLIKKISSKTKVIMLVHVLGNSTNLKKIIRVARKKKIIIIEDTCESLGSKYSGKYLGTFGDFGTYSFYYSHQITSGEGGMIACNDQEDYDLLLTMRSHGWSRGVKNQKRIEKKYKKLDPRFIFVNAGFNLRPTDVTAAIGLNQFKKLDQFVKIRNYNNKKIFNSLTQSKKWNNQFTFFKINKKIKPSFFGFPLLMNRKYLGKRKIFLNILEKFGVETRPIISGNFLNQPAIKLFKLGRVNAKYPKSEDVQNLGFFLGLHLKRIDNQILKKLTNILFKIDTI
jgi:CDP-6-deoxy-D-xylo-4-hexulose-3-dehydrase